MTHRIIHHFPTPSLLTRTPRPRAPPSLSYRLLISSLAVLTFLLPFGLSYFSLAELDVCVVDRFPEAHRNAETADFSAAAIASALNSSEGLTDLSDSVTAVLTEDVAATSMQPTTIMLACLLACCLIKSFLPSSSHPQLSTLRFLELLKVLLAYMWYLAAYFLCNALKGFMGDLTCNVHANSISGHYLFHLYCGLALLHLHASQTHATQCSLLSSAFYQRLFRSNVNKLFMFVLTCYALISAIILMNTYLHGYHSLRQILYGVCMALVSHWLMMETLDMLDELLIHHFDTHAADSSKHSAPAAAYAQLSQSAQMRKRAIGAHSPPFSVATTPTSHAASLPPGSRSTPGSAHGSGSLLDLSPRVAVSSALTAPVAPMAPRYVSSFSPFQRLLFYCFQYLMGVTDERGVFFLFPFVLIGGVQLIAFVLLLYSPASGMWRGADLLVLAVSWLVLAYLLLCHLKLPVSSSRKEQPQLAAFSAAVSPRRWDGGRWDGTDKAAGEPLMTQP
jgi:hypothetical protein